MFSNITRWFQRKTKSMANPLILTEEEWMPRQAEFAVYDKAYSEPTVATVEPKSFTMRARRIITEALAAQSKDGAKSGSDQLPQAPVWGPTVKAEQAVSVYFRLVPQGTEDQHESTDGMRAWPLPPRIAEPMGMGPMGSNLPGMDAQGSGGGGSFSKSEGIDPRLVAAGVLQKQLDEAKVLLAHQQESRPITPAAPQKLYRVTEAVEVTADEISAEMGKRRRMNGKPVVYIKGSIVEPRLRVEI